MSTNTPWDWIPDQRAWCEDVARGAEAWSPAPGLCLPVDEFRKGIRRAADEGLDWILHPCMSRLTQATPVEPARDLILAAWVAGHTGCPGEIELTSPVELWSAAGDKKMRAGRCALRALGAAMVERGPTQLALDLWCRSTGVVTAGSWASLDNTSLSSRRPELTQSIHQFLTLMSALAQATPSLLAWVLAATRVLRPLVPIAGYARSSHDPEVPGLIEADLSRGPTQTIELIAHETAHLHLRAAQAAAPLVDPHHRSTYHSPLRREPRPLIGILLAYHALAYICAALRQVTAAAILSPKTAARALDDLARRCDDARATMDRARCHLTPAGAQFLDRTHKVADFVFI
ncbi:hypothetical protein LMG28614_05602 [Paraburkholderia ultramafica]|uniref:HEXXH motif domain-containing protein n=1 Tax=Paraburkholderia ultramafica TaxID=1544867 RepID=A0A6S7BKU6_9BURK|nr:HEXXH motif-containing putative peptide modification protein [Paraburkholderia ultramafica]CAB3802406.1 hypothetical protein LMG28614_05602 [Paraburkholderia ultramafica]